MPIITRSLLIINTTIYLCIAVLSFSDNDLVRSIYETFGLIPVSFLDGFFWQPLTSLFLHFPHSPLHLIVNMIGLWSFGSFIERQIGSSNFSWLYFISGLSGSLLVIFVPYFMGSYQAMVQPTVGASGALIGLLGGVAVLYPQAKLFLLFFPMRARTAAIILAVGSFLLAIFDSQSFISHHGHLGGILGGFIYTYLVLLPNLKKQTSTHTHKSKAATYIETSLIQDTNYIEVEQKGKRDLPKPAIPKQSSIDIEHPATSKIDFDSEAQETEEQTTKRLVYDPSTGKFHYK